MIRFIVFLADITKTVDWALKTNYLHFFFDQDHGHRKDKCESCIFSLSSDPIEFKLCMVVTCMMYDYAQHSC